MVTLSAVFALACVTCLLLTPWARRLARRWGLVDRPDGRRKTQATEMPLGGGLAIFAAAGAAVATALAMNPLGAELVRHRQLLLGLLLSSGIIAAVGLRDDYRPLRGRHKLLGQLLAVAVVVRGGVLVQSVQLFHWHLDLGLLAVPFTVFLLLGTINALNLMDGMDGLLSCVGLIACLALAVVAVLAGHPSVACLAAALAGALLGFLRYNFPPATVFMGDCGSMLVGLMVGVLAIRSSLETAEPWAMAVPLAVLTVPIFDTCVAIVRRKLAGRSVYSTDRGHLHHCLLRRGWSTRVALSCVSALCLLAMTGAMAGVAWKSDLLALCGAAAVVGILLATRLFGHTELLLLKKQVANWARTMFWRRAARPVEFRLQGSRDWPRLWHMLMSRAEQLDLQSICLDVNAPALHEGFVACWNRGLAETEEDALWRAQLPLAAGGQVLGRVEIVGQRDHESAGMKIAALARLLDDLDGAICAIAGIPRVVGPENGSAGERAGRSEPHHGERRALVH